MFHAKVYQFPSGYQIRIYEHGIIEKSKGDYFPGEEVAPEKEFNPFSKRWEHIPEIADPERCAKISLSRTKQMIHYLTRSNFYQWFVTWTFDPDKVDSFDYAACARHLSDWLSNAKKRCPGMRYIVVPERHKSGRYHFHGLLSDCDDLGFVDSGHRSKGDIIYNIGSYKLGFTTATRVKDMGRVARYILKYITKDMVGLTKGRKRYWASRNLLRAPIRPVLIKLGMRNKLCSFLAERAGYMKEVQNFFNNVMYFDLFASDPDIECFIRQEE